MKTILFALIVAIGSFLFGYQTAIIGSALLFIRDQFALSSLQEAQVVSFILIGATIGAIVGGELADRIGRKITLFLTIVICAAGTLMFGMGESYAMLLAGRAVIGFAIGVISVVVPLYIAEISPAKMRGLLVTFGQLGITIGIFVAYLVAYYYSGTSNWRMMVLVSLIPAAVQFIGLFFIPETVHEMKKKSVGHKRGHNWKKILTIGVGLSIFQQIVGINAVIYYTPSIFQLAGFTTPQTAIFATLLVGAINVLATIIAMPLVDRLGRRPLLFIGLIGMAASLAFLGFFNQGTSAVVAVMCYVTAFAISMGPITWIVISEIFPLELRGLGMGIASFANWACNYLVSVSFLSFINWVGFSQTFWIYALICVAGLWFVYKLVPETKGKTLLQIQKFWEKR
jgi:MFS family permease